MTNYDHLLEKIRSFVTDSFRDHKNDAYVYHNLRHTRDVADAAETICAFYKITGADYFVVLTSAWFHDLGYLTDREHHEEKGAEIAARFLAAEHIDDEIIEKVRGCILATRLPQQPHNLLEEIVCDADLFHFGTEHFNKRSKLLLEEYNNLHDNAISKTAWQDKTITMMEAHHYFTDYGLLYLTRTKEQNLHKLKHKVHHEKITTDTTAMEHKKKSHHHENGGEEKIEVKERPDRGSETMFRISSNNHSRLSQLADNKAHILITVNSIILSAVISLVLRRLTNNGYLIVPSFILLLVSVTTIVFAILATRPTIPPGVFTPEEIAQKKVNLLFFGNFFKMDLDAYRAGMLQVMHDRDLVFDNLIRDVYSQGVVLGRKYRLLHIAYNVFMYGLIVAVVAFIIASAIPHATAAQPLPLIDSLHGLSHHVK